MSSNSSDEGSEGAVQFEPYFPDREELSSAFSDSSNYRYTESDDRFYKTDSGESATPAPKTGRPVRKVLPRIFKYSPQTYCECQKSFQSNRGRKKETRISSQYERCETCQEFIDNHYKHCKAECFEERGRINEPQLAAFLNLAFTRRNHQVR